MIYDIAIVGGGIIGTACAYALSRYRLSAILLEKENDVATGATRANSAIIHAGFDPEPGTLMAKLNVRGNEMAERLCAELSVPFQRIGSLVLAFSEEDRRALQVLLEQGNANGVPDLQILTGEQARAMEPELSGQVAEALYAPSSGIVNPWEYAIAMAEVAAANGVKIQLEAEVQSIGKMDGAYTISTMAGEFQSKVVINAAGIASDMIHNMVAAPAFTVHPCRGEYYMMDKCEGQKVKHTLFHCPNHDGKGVLVSPTVHGNLIVGPNADAVDEPSRAKTTAEGLAYIKKEGLRSVPGIVFRNSIRNFAGIRANTDQKDFVIQWADDRFLDVAGIKSPGLSAAPAIAEMVVKLLAERNVPLIEKTDAVMTRKKVSIRTLNAEQWNAAIRENPHYGRVICRCETVTEGEIVDAIHAPVPARTVDAVKRRTNAGIGRCQGGFCSTRIVEIMARELQEIGRAHV